MAEQRTKYTQWYRRVHCPQGFVAIEVDGEQWHVLRGFGAAFARVASLPPEPEVVRDMLELVGVTAGVDQIAGWSRFRQVEAQVWATNEHFRASDNVVQRYPRPAWIPEPWRGPMRGEGIFAQNPTPIEVRS